MEILLTVLTVLAATAGIATYYQKYVVEANETRQYRIDLFESARRHNSELLAMLRDFVSKHNAADMHLRQGFTFQEAISLLEKAEYEILNDQGLERLRRGEGNSLHLKNFTDRLETHVKHVIEAKNSFLQSFKH